MDGIDRMRTSHRSYRVPSVSYRVLMESYHLRPFLSSSLRRSMFWRSFQRWLFDVGCSMFGRKARTGHQSPPTLRPPAQNNKGDPKGRPVSVIILARDR